ncbi:Sfum_1244 family protein [Desulfocastanea catecholica]
MTASNQDKAIIEDIQHNCNISDARDHGIYTMCTMVLKLRNLYKWENDLEPWQEPEPADLLDWIEAKEIYWETIAEEPYHQLDLDGCLFLPDDSSSINAYFSDKQMVYGVGYGRSMKAVFFLAEKIEQRTVAGLPVLILGKERAREMASPFAMAQDGVIFIRKESLRFFLWDYIQELRSSCRNSFRHALQLYGLLQDGQLNQQRFKDNLDNIVEAELDLFIYHEVGEVLQTTFDSSILQTIISRFPGSVYELVSRSIKDILADTHPGGLLSHLISEKLETSLSFYVGFLDGLRKELFPEIISAQEKFQVDGNWQGIEQARSICRDNILHYAEKIKTISQYIGHESDDYVRDLFNHQILLPLRLEIPQSSPHKIER